MKIKRLLTCAGLMAFTILQQPVMASDTSPNVDSDPIWSGFVDPPATARPYVRWWWNGNKLAQKEILRELDALKRAGIGGVEINSIRFPADHDPLSIPSLEWLSEEWCKMVKTATEGARMLDMKADIIVGSGWPFGGRFLPREHQTKILTVGRKQVAGPAAITVTKEEMLANVDLHLHSKNNEILQTVRFVRLTPAEANDFDPGVDLTESFKGGKLSATIPAGDHILHYFVVQEGFQAVINGAPGSDGAVLNHFSKEATEFYLNRMSEEMLPILGELDNHFRAFFCDSLELEGANWNDDLLLEFQRRRGYDLLPWLPYLLKKTGHMGNNVDAAVTVKAGPVLKDAIERVRYDYWITLIELFRERFLQPFTDWCHTQGGQSRVQAYGRCYHPLESSMLVDIPECETWLNMYTGRNQSSGSYSLNNKFTASGARLAGKRIVSCEEITNTDYVFFTPLELIKIAGDESNLSGVTHSILHGFNYSPPEAGFPGWVRYGTYFSEQNSWWPHIRRWTDYKARLSWLLQKSDPQATIAVIHPLADLWKCHGMQRDPFPATRHPAYAHELWRAIHNNGFNCDYMSENTICQAEMNDGKVTFGNRSYEVIVLMEVDTLRPDTAAALARYAASGGRIIFLGRPPSLAPGLKARGKGDLEVAQTMDRIVTQYSELCHIVPAPNKGTDLAQWFRKVCEQYNLQPDVKLDSVNHFLTQTHHEFDDRKMFFFVNSSRDQAVSVRAVFNTGDHTPWIWDLETGTRRVHDWIEKRNVLQLDLSPAESRVLVFEKEQAPKPSPKIRPSEQSAIQLSGTWQLTLEHVDGTSKSLSLEELCDLVGIEGLGGFAGRAIYQTQITVPPDAGIRFVDLGDVREISEVTLDGSPLGCRWYGRHLYSLPKELPPGKHQLSVTVTTVLGNYCKSLANNRTAQGWTSRHDNHPMGLLGPVRLLRAQFSRQDSP